MTGRSDDARGSRPPAARGGAPRRGAPSTSGASRGAGPRGHGRRDEASSRSPRPRSESDITRGGRGRGGSSDRRDRGDQAPGTERPRRGPAPELPPEADPKLLDRGARAGLRSLPESLADRVAAHLVAAGQLLDDDPVAADRHARYARQLAPRLAVVREAVALTAYRNGDYATALSDLRALRRMTGDASYLPVMADCERGLGRPERAIALARDSAAATLDPAGKIELAIVVSGARRDRGEATAAVAALRPYVQSKAVRPWTARLWYAYADALLEAGQASDARDWLAAAASVDEDEETDAAERLAALDTSLDEASPADS